MKCNSITRESTLIYYRNFVGISRWERQLALKIRDFEIRKSNSNHRQASGGGGGKTTSTEQFVGRKSPLKIPNNKLLDHKKTLHEGLLRNYSMGEIKYN